MDQHFNYLFNNPYNIHYSFDCNGTAWFYASEIARNLGYDRPWNMVRMCYSNEIIKLTIGHPTIEEIGLDMSAYAKLENSLCEFSNSETPSNGVSDHGGARNFVIINEYGVYRIAMSAKSSRPEIEAFKNWVLYVLIPSVRRHDAYIGPEAATRIQTDPNYINTLIAENEALRHQVELHPLYHVIDKTQYPYCDYEEMKKFEKANREYTNVGMSLYHGNENITLNQLAKIISQSINPRFGSTQLKAMLRESNFLMKTARDFNKPTQLAISRGLMVFSYPKEDQDQYEVLVTPAGVKYFINLAISKGYGD